LGRVRSCVCCCDVDAGLAFIDQALALNPNLAAAWNYSGWIRIMLGEHQSAIDRFERALRLSPRTRLFFICVPGLLTPISWLATMTRLHPQREIRYGTKRGSADYGS
jgi:tetratricopeptide (TPR) repeat protein